MTPPCVLTGIPPGAAAKSLLTESLRSNGGRELAAQPDEETLERERGVHVELLELAPRLADELGRALGRLEPLEARVLLQLGKVVEVDHRTLRPGRDDDEVAVPGGELVEGLEHLLALGAELRSPQTLLALAVG